MLRRKTVLKFANCVEMENAFRQSGNLSVRQTHSRIVYKDGQDKVSYDTKAQLEKHGIEVQTVREWYREYCYIREEDIKKAYDVEGCVYLWSTACEIVTYDQPAFQHKKEVRKVYNRMKKIGIKPTYSCESEVTSTNCV